MTEAIDLEGAVDYPETDQHNLTFVNGNNWTLVSGNNLVRVDEYIASAGEIALEGIVDFS